MFSGLSRVEIEVEMDDSGRTWSRNRRRRNISLKQVEIAAFEVEMACKVELG